MSSNKWLRAPQKQQLRSKRLARSCESTWPEELLEEVAGLGSLIVNQAALSSSCLDGRVDVTFGTEVQTRASTKGRSMQANRLMARKKEGGTCR